MASYNHGKYLACGIESIIGQTYADWELIVVDDGSKDESMGIIRNYLKRFPDRIYLYTHSGHKNKNISRTYQLALSKVRGEYCAFLESDDSWHPDKLERMIEVLETNNDVVLAYSDVELVGDIDGAGILFARQHSRNLRNVNCRLKNKPFDAMPLMFGGNIVPTFSACVIRSSVLNELDYTEKHQTWLDWWLWSQIAMKGKFYYVHERLTNFRVHDQSCNFKHIQSINHDFQADIFRIDLLHVVVEKLLLENNLELASKIFNENRIVSNRYLELLKWTSIFSPFLMIYRFSKRVPFLKSLRMLMEKCIYIIKRGFH